MTRHPPARTDRPAPGNAPMGEQAAAWVRDHVWPAWMKAMDDDYPGRGCFLLRTCACELGVCVPCSQAEPRHDRCVTRQRDGRPYGWDADLFALACCDVVSHAHSLAMVTQVGYSCRWQCPCGCWREPLPEARPEPKLEPLTQPRQVVTVDQLDLFAGVAG